jgi:hypothetical protein
MAAFEARASNTPETLASIDARGVTFGASHLLIKN